MSASSPLRRFYDAARALINAPAVREARDAAADMAARAKARRCIRCPNMVAEPMPGAASPLICEECIADIRQKGGRVMGNFVGHVAASITEAVWSDGGDRRSKKR